MTQTTKIVDGKLTAMQDVGANEAKWIGRISQGWQSAELAIQKMKSSLPAITDPKAKQAMSTEVAKMKRSLDTLEDLISRAANARP